jgi:protein-arginine kinase activator protein McsA
MGLSSTNNMSNHRLSLEQRFRLETAFREIDACDDIEMLREITKQIITSEENEKAAVREAITQMRRELEVEFISKHRNHSDYSSIANRDH